MDLRQELRLRTVHVPNAKLLCRMGYRHSDKQAAVRLEWVRDDPVLGLTTAFPQPGSRRFLQQLCLVAGVEAYQTEQAIRALERRIENQPPAPWLFVDTDSDSADTVDDSELSSALLVVREFIRRLDLPGNVRFEAASEQIRQAQRFVREHMHESGGCLSPWGRILRYLFFYGQGRCLEISVDGKGVAESPDFVVPERSRPPGRGRCGLGDVLKLLDQ